MLALLKVIHCDLLDSALIVHIWIQEVCFLYMAKRVRLIMVYGRKRRQMRLVLIIVLCEVSSQTVLIHLGGR